MIYANFFAPMDGKLRVYSVSHGKHITKSDCFVISYGHELYLIDGGISGSFHALDFLLDLRKSYLGNRKDLYLDSDCKLRINLFISHFHNDHVEALIESVLVSPYLDFGDVYYPEECGTDKKYNKLARNGDIIYRPAILKLLKQLHPNHKTNMIPFGSENVLSFNTNTGLTEEVKFTVCPLPFDPGTHDYLEFMIDSYGDENGRIERNASTYTLNAASLWVHAKLGKVSFLFTGDTMKRRDDLPNEANDFMIAAYRDLLGDTTVVKYIHHGYIRDTGAKAMMSFDPEYILVTTQHATAEAAIRAIDPDTKIKFVNSALESIKFVCDADGNIETASFR